MSNADKVKYLIIGNSAGGIGAAEAIREIDSDGNIAIVSDEPYPVYSRPLISKHLAEKCSLERMLFRPDSFYTDKAIQTMLGTKVESIDPEIHAVTLDDGKTISWEKLLLATGGIPVIPKIEGAGLEGVFTFTTLDDAIAIDRFLNRHQKKTKAVVIGGGLIGVSVTEALTKRGVQVTIVEMMDRILSTILDDEASALVAKSLRHSGISIITGTTASKINSHQTDEARSVSLGDGRDLPCELVILAAGIRPRTELAASSGIKINRGIAVDRHMRTSKPDIYACGDAAEVFDFIYGENRLTPIWPNAYIGGRVAGLNMAGEPAEYEGGTAMNALHYFGLAVTSAGLVTPPDDSYTVLCHSDDGSYRMVIAKDGLVEGMAFIGDIERSGIIFGLMKDRVNIAGLEQTLVGDDFGLISLPKDIWRSRLERRH